MLLNNNSSSHRNKLKTHLNPSNNLHKPKAEQTLEQVAYIKDFKTLRTEMFSISLNTIMWESNKHLPLQDRWRSN